MSKLQRPGPQQLYELFLLKYGTPETTGPGPRRRLRFGYYQPPDHYEALLASLVTETTDWIDVGGGRALFPQNPALSRRLSERCRKLVAVDPSENIYDNPYAHEKVMSMIEDYRTDQQFDLATFRMVAEHIDAPESVIETLGRLVRPGGKVVIFTINRWSPVPIVTQLLPFRLHHPIKRFFWGGEERDTFPTTYKMNTRQQLSQLFTSGGFDEVLFEYIDDLAVFKDFTLLNYLELSIWSLLRKAGLRYPENCLLGVYERRAT